MRVQLGTGASSQRIGSSVSGVDNWDKLHDVSETGASS